MNKKDMNFLQILNKSDISLFGDVDNDKVPNVFDCKPLDPNRDGLFGRAVNILSGGRYGQTREAYETEKTLKRVEQKRNIEQQIEKQQAMNTLIEQKIKLQKLQAREQKLKQEKRLQASLHPSVARQAVSIMFGVPMPQQQMLYQKPGYYLESTGPKAPKGFKWKKIPKSKETVVCPNCGIPLMVMPGPFGQPILRCPRCGGVFA